METWRHISCAGRIPPPASFKPATERAASNTGVHFALNTVPSQTAHNLTKKSTTSLTHSYDSAVCETSAHVRLQTRTFPLKLHGCVKRTQRKSSAEKTKLQLGLKEPGFTFSSGAPERGLRTRSPRYETPRSVRWKSAQIRDMFLLRTLTHAH